VAVARDFRGQLEDAPDYFFGDVQHVYDAADLADDDDYVGIYGHDYLYGNGPSIPGKYG